MMKLLAATDLLPKSEFAVDRAGLLADELGADLSLLHVVSPVSSGRVLEQSLEMAIARMKSRVRRPLWRHATTPEVLVRAGNPARVILDTLASEDPALLIVGPHDRRTSVIDAMAGTVVEKAVSARKSPVLVVQQTAKVAYRNVLLALDAAPASRFALRTAEQLVLRDGVPATVIHAEGNPLREIMRAIEARKPDLLVMGTRGDGRMRRAVLGSVANQLLRTAPCDMLVVPYGAGAASLAPGASSTAHSSAHMSA